MLSALRWMKSPSRRLANFERWASRLLLTVRESELVGVGARSKWTRLWPIALWSTNKQHHAVSHSTNQCNWIQWICVFKSNNRRCKLSNQCTIKSMAVNSAEWHRRCRNGQSDNVDVALLTKWSSINVLHIKIPGRLPKWKTYSFVRIHSDRSLTHTHTHTFPAYSAHIRVTDKNLLIKIEIECS